MGTADGNDGGDTNNTDEDDSGNHSDDDSVVEVVPTRARRNTRRTAIKPTTLAYYPTAWKSFLQLAKQEYRLHIATIHAFPEKENHLHEARDVIARLMLSWTSAGDYLEPGMFDLICFQVIFD